MIDNISHADVVYEPLVRKLAQYLINLENETEFLSNSVRNVGKLRWLLESILADLNDKGRTLIIS